MLLVKSIIPKKINVLSCSRLASGFLFFICFFTFSSSVNGQDNSPYSRYGLGDIVPNTNIINRGMGGISAAYSDPLSINFTNPASYSSFKAFLEEKSKKVTSARVLFDVGINIENRTLKTVNPPEKFTASNALFSYVQVGLPIKNNWGINFGLRPVSRISYKIVRREKLFDPGTNLPIDSALTEFSGDGGAYLPSIGTGFAIFDKAIKGGRRHNLSVGINFGYLFGNKEYATKRAFVNDSVAYNNSNHTTSTSFGDLFFNAGIQYKIDLSQTTSLKIGAFGNLKNKIDAEQDIIRETFFRDAASGDIRLDSVYEEKGISGEIIYPSSYGVGFTLERLQTLQQGGWLLGVDVLQNKWSDYRFYGSTDAVKDNWELRVGGQFRPKPGRNYWSNVAYRAGFAVGPDYINVQQNLPMLDISLGVGLPLANYNRLSPGQFSIINLAFEYNKRGNNDNLLKESLFRFSVGLSFSDLWFGKRKYQ